MNTTPRRRRLAAFPLAPLTFALAMATAAGTAQADVVTDLNAVVSSAPVAPRFGGPQQQSRAIAMIQIAVHDALNAIDRRYETYSVVPTASANASPDAAVAAAITDRSVETPMISARDGWPSGLRHRS